MHNLRKAAEKISELEELTLFPHCNCRVATAFHDATCLRSILENQSIPCPVHGFRSLQYFLRVLVTNPVLPTDWAYCPCGTLAQLDQQIEVDTFQKLKVDFNRQLEFSKQVLDYPRGPHPHSEANAIFTGLKWNEDGKPDVASISAEERELIWPVVRHYYKQRRKWKDSGRPLPRWFDIFMLNIRRFDPRVANSVSGKHKGW